MHQTFYSSHWDLENQIFSLFLVVKMDANYAEMCRVGTCNLEADFQQVYLVQFFWIFHNIIMKSQTLEFSKEK